jgi:hypothetical protein
MNLKLTSFILVLCLVFGAGFYFANETNAQEKTYKIGDKGPGGGWVFYDKGNTSEGWRYLEAAPEDQGKAKWGCFKKLIPGAKGTAIGTGKANTAAIIKSCGESGIAAKLASSYRGGGKSDWFLPSKDEIKMMYDNLHKSGVGGFADSVYDDSFYWSSSEGYSDSFGFAWRQGFADRYPNHGSKDRANRVRAVRAF